MDVDVDVSPCLHGTELGGDGRSHSPGEDDGTDDGGELARERQSQQTSDDAGEANLDELLTKLNREQ